MGTEQETEGLSEAEANKLFKNVFGSFVNSKDPVIESNEQPTPESAPVVTNEAEATETEAASTDAAQESETPETQQETTDPYESLPETIRNRIKELEDAAKERDLLRHRLKSDEGRVAAHQRKANELERLLREKTAKAQETTTQKLKVEESEEWRTLSESDPVLARLIKTTMEESVRQAKEEARVAAEAATKPLYEERETEYERREREELYKLVPNLDEVKSSPLYAEWFETQDESVKNLGYSARGVYRIMQLYDADMRARFGAGEQASQEPAKVTDNKPAPAAPNQKVAAIEEERKRRAQTQGVASKTQSAPVELNDEDYYKKVFNQHINKR